MSVRAGLQLFSIRTELARNPWGTLEAIAGAGFTRLEAANHHALEDPGIGLGLPARELRSHLDDLGLAVIGCHVNPLDEAVIPRALEYQAELGSTQIGCDIEFFPPGDRDHVLRRTDIYNRIGELARAHGMRFYYHNHFQEFQRLGDDLVYDLILENTDPSLVFLEIDTYWMYRGGQDPLEWIRRTADRVVMLHQKDFPADARQPLNLFDGVVDPAEAIDMTLFEARKDPRSFVEIGTGILPIQDIIDEVAALPAFDTLLLEQDHSQLPELESIRRSKLAFDASFHGISWG